MEKWQSVGEVNGEDVSVQDGWLWIGEDEADIQTLATDTLDYRYTHGGWIYRKACELAWAWLEQK